MEPVMKYCYPFVGTGQCPVPTNGWDEIENDGCENIKNKLFFKMQTQNQKQIKTRKRNRLRGYDYSQNGWYFVTICIKDKVKYLGEIKNEKMEYSQYGEIILKFWQEIPKHYKNVFLDEWIIMPDHIHGIIVIENLIVAAVSVGTGQCPVPTDTGNGKNYGQLSKIVKSFKEISTKTIRENYNDYEFAWQRSFYDHIIRNEKSLNKIREYIRNNLQKWELDKNDLENLSM